MSVSLRKSDPAPGFSTYSLRGVLPMGHVLNVDHFVMSRPIFPPHPHAGFSAVTYLLPSSAGAFLNRDSLGDRSRIDPGGLHWTRAAAGMHHEEVPETPGIAAEGLQIFVKLPYEQELDPPAAYRLPSAAQPRVVRGPLTIAVLAGSCEGARSPIPSDGTTLLFVSLEPGVGEFEVPEGQEAFALALRGEGQLEGEPLAAHQAAPLPSGRVVRLSTTGRLELLVGAGPALPRPVHFGGPFAFFDRERLDQAFERHRRGDTSR